MKRKEGLLKYIARYERWPVNHAQWQREARRLARLCEAARGERLSEFDVLLGRTPRRRSY